MKKQTRIELVVLAIFVLAIIGAYYYEHLFFSSDLVTDEGVYRVTAYCACEECCLHHANGITASGYVLKPDGDKLCATDSHFPFGTLLIIPGYGMVPVEDRGPVGYHIDVYFLTHQEAKEWGVQFLSIQSIRSVE